MMNVESCNEKLSRLVIHPGEAKDVHAIHGMQVDWAGEECTYGFHTATTTDITAQLGPYLLVAEWTSWPRPIGVPVRSRVSSE